MCDPLSIALIAGGQFINYMNNKAAMDSRENVQKMSALRQQQLGEQKNKSIMELIAEYEPNKHVQDRNALEDKYKAQHVGTIDRIYASDSHPFGTSTSGNVSDAYLTQRASKEAETMKRILGYADAISTMMGIGAVRQDQGNKAAGHSADASLAAYYQKLAGDSAGAAISNIQPDPLWSTIGGAMQSYGMGNAVKGAFTTPGLPSKALQDAVFMSSPTTIAAPHGLNMIGNLPVGSFS